MAWPSDGGGCNPGRPGLSVCNPSALHYFTPDCFKALTRVKRAKDSEHGIAHLMTPEEMISTKQLNHCSISKTMKGKQLIGTYLSRNLEHMNLCRSVTLDVDSELHLFHELGCSERCRPEDCTCAFFSRPVRSFFDRNGDYQESKLLNIKQRKGEGELSQVDWLLHYLPLLTCGQSCLSIVTSGDIDALPAHMTFISRYWPRNEDKSFIFPVYVLLRKQGGGEFYNVTAIVETLEAHFKDRHAGLYIAACLSLGGNDFFPKLHGHTHPTILRAIVESEMISSLFDIECEDEFVTGMTINFTSYKKLFKYL